MSMFSVTNNNLYELISELQELDEVSHKHQNILNIELSVSTLICPSVEGGLQLMCKESSPDELFIPAFTSLHDYIEFFGLNSFEPIECDFMGLVESANDDVIGLMINPASQNFFIPLDRLKQIKTIEFPPVIKVDGKKSDFKKLLKSSHNNDLFNGIEYDEFILPNYNQDNFIKFLKKFKTKPYFLMVASDEELKRKPNDGVFRASQLTQLGYYNVDTHGSSKMLIFSDEKSAHKEHSHKEMDYNFFITTMSFPNLVEIVLRSDSDGLIVNHSTKPIFLHRDLLVSELDNILKYSHNPELDLFSKFFKLI